MESPRVGLRRARAASWALAGLGIAGVVGTSALAYADTVKPPATDAPVAVVEPIVPPPGPSTVEERPAPLGLTAMTEAPAPPTTTSESAPTTQESSVPSYTPEYVPPQSYERAPSTITDPSQAASTAPTSTAPTTKRRIVTPTTVMAPSFAPPVSTSRGS